MFSNFEAMPEAVTVTDPFCAVDLFRPPPLFGAALPQDHGLPPVPQLPPPFGFHFYTIGKSAVRLNVRAAYPNGVHSFDKPGGGIRRAPAPCAYILHYACCGFDAFWRKYRRLGRFADRWSGATDIRAEIGALHLDARDVVMCGDKAAALDFYRRRIAIEDRSLSEMLVRHGVLMRICEPQLQLSRT